MPRIIKLSIVGNTDSRDSINMLKFEYYTLREEKSMVRVKCNTREGAN